MDAAEVERRLPGEKRGKKVREEDASQVRSFVDSKMVSVGCVSHSSIAHPFYSPQTAGAQRDPGQRRERPGERRDKRTGCVGRGEEGGKTEKKFKDRQFNSQEINSSPLKCCQISGCGCLICLTYKLLWQVVKHNI